jgi:hypothetical protein
LFQDFEQDDDSGNWKRRKIAKDDDEDEEEADVEADVEANGNFISPKSSYPACTLMRP